MTMSSLRSNSLLPLPVFQAAAVTAPSGTYTTGSFTDANNHTWTFYRWTVTAGSIQVTTAGYVDLLVAGSGAGGSSASGFTSGGGAGALRFGLFWVPIGTYTVTIGAGGAGGTDGNSSSFGSILRAGGGQAGYSASGSPGSNFSRAGFGGGGSPGGFEYGIGTSNAAAGGAGGTVYGSNAYSGVTLNYANSSVEYGIGGYTGGAGTANTGNGGWGTTGGSGIVIARIRTN